MRSGLIRSAVNADLCERTLCGASRPAYPPLSDVRFSKEKDKDGFYLGEDLYVYKNKDG